MEAVKRYRKKPVVIEAVQLGEDNGAAIFKWILGHGGEGIVRQDGSLLIHTLEGDHHAQKGDWIIRGVAGEFYPCKPEIFAQTYDLDEHPIEPEPMGA